MKKIYLNEFHKQDMEKGIKAVQKMMQKPRTFEEVKEQTRRLGREVKTKKYLNEFHKQVSEKAQKSVQKMMQNPLTEEESDAQFKRIKDNTPQWYKTRVELGKMLREKDLIKEIWKQKGHPIRYFKNFDLENKTASQIFEEIIVDLGK